MMDSVLGNKQIHSKMEKLCWCLNDFRIEERCDQIINCKDNSDEENCYLLVFKEVKSYNKKVPPFTITKDNSLMPANIKVSMQLKNVLAISEFTHTIDLKFGITLKWYENRVLYHNLKTSEALNVLSDDEVYNLFILCL